MEEKINGLLGKLIIKAELEIKSGLHIGAGSDFSSIGAVDNVVVRDSFTKKPYIPGSSLKGKMRYLLARIYAKNGKMQDFKYEDKEIGRLFGQGIYTSRLQFQDIFFNEESSKIIQKKDTDLYLTEIKFENSINRISAKATPRQLERVPKGSKFDFKLIYNVENIEANELKRDIENIGKVLGLLQDDYLGGSGTRGYGKVKFDNIEIKFKQYVESKDIIHYEEKSNIINNAKETIENQIKVG